MARTKIDILTPIPKGRDFNTTETFISGTLVVIYNGVVHNVASDFTEYGTFDGFKLNFYLPSDASPITDNFLAIYSIPDRTGVALQETLRKINEETRFQFITRSGLTDVRITIFENVGNTKLVDSVLMTEKETNSGVYEYSFIPTAVGEYTAVMKDNQDNNMQVTEIIVLEGNLQDVFDIVNDIRNIQVLGTPKIIIGDPC